MTLPPVTQPPVGMAGWVRQVAYQIKRLSKAIDNLTGAGSFSALLGKLRNTVNFYDSLGALAGKLTFAGNNNDPLIPRRFGIYGGNNVSPQIEYVGAYTDNDGTFFYDTVNIWANVGMPSLPGTGASGNVYYDVNTKQLSYVPSSERYKQDVKRNVDWDPVIDSLNSITPVAFRYRKGEGRVLYGLIAEDIAAQGPHMRPFVDWSLEGDPEGLNNFTAGLVAWNQRLEKRVKALRDAGLALQDTVTTMQAQIATMQAQIAALQTPPAAP